MRKVILFRQLEHSLRVRCWRHGRSVSCGRKWLYTSMMRGRAGTAASSATAGCLQQRTVAFLMASRWMRTVMCTRALARVWLSTAQVRVRRCGTPDLPLYFTALCPAPLRSPVLSLYGLICICTKSETPVASLEGRQALRCDSLLSLTSSKV